MPETPPISKVEPLVTPSTDQEAPEARQLRLRHVLSKPDKESTEEAPVQAVVSQSKPTPTAISTQKGKPLKIAVPPASDSTIDSLARTSTDNHTGVREQLQPCTPTTGAPSHVSSSPSKPKRSVEKPFPDKAPSKTESSSKTPTETPTGNPQPQSSKKSKAVRRLSSKSKMTPEVSPLPPVVVKELERKASESSIDSTSTSTDKSEETDSPSSQVVTNFVSEVKKPPPPPTKEPNTGQTIHPPETPDGSESSKPEQLVEAQTQKKESVAGPPVRVKGKKKMRQQQKKEEKSRRKEKEKEKDRERDKEKEVEKPDTPIKQPAGALEDSSSSNSTEQLEEDSSPPPSMEDPAVTEVASEQDDKPPSTEPDKCDTAEEESSETSVSPPPVAPAVPSTAIKTSRAKQPVKEAPLSDPLPQMPDRTSKKATSKKPLEKKPSVTSPSRSSPPVKDLPEPEVEQLSDSPRQRPQTLPVIKTELAEEPPLETPFDSGSLVETDGVSQTLDPAKNSAQSLPTSPHELAASLLSNNSAIKRRRRKSDRDRPGEVGEDEEEFAKPDEQDESVTKQPEVDSPPKEESSPNSNQFKPLSTLSLDAEPFYPSPNCLPSKHRPSTRPDPRKYADYNQPSRHPPSGFSPIPDDPYIGPYPDQPYFKNHPRPPRISDSMTPSPPLPYGAFPDGGHSMLYGDYPPPPLDPHEPGMDDPYYPPEELPPPPPVPMGRYGERYRGRSPMITPKGGYGRPNVDSYMIRQQQLAQHRRAMREYGGGYSPAGPWDKPHGMKPPSMDEMVYQQYIRKRHYLTSLIQQEKAIAAIEREQVRRSVDTPVFGPEVGPPPTLGPRPWDNPELNELAQSEDMDLMHRRQRQILEQGPARPSRSRTYSTESDLGGEFVSDFQTPSTVGAPGQQVSSRAESSSSTASLAPGRAKSSGWPSSGQVRPYNIVFY